MELSLKKYLSTALNCLIPFALLEILLFILYFTSDVPAGFFAIINVVDIICLLLPGTNYLIMFFVFKKKCKDFTPIEGIVSNWDAGFRRFTGCVIIKVGDNEFSTSAYFSHEECKELVVKTILYAIIDELLFIYSIKD